MKGYHAVVSAAVCAIAGVSSGLALGMPGWQILLAQSFCQPLVYAITAGGHYLGTGKWRWLP